MNNNQLLIQFITPNVCEIHTLNFNPNSLFQLNSERCVTLSWYVIASSGIWQDSLHLQKELLLPLNYKWDTLRSSDLSPHHKVCHLG